MIDESEEGAGDEHKKLKSETTLHFAIDNDMEGLVHLLSHKAFSKFEILAESLKAESYQLFKRMVNNCTATQMAMKEAITERNLYCLLAWNRRSSGWTDFSQTAHRLLRRNKVDPFEPDKHGRTALFYACKRLKRKLVSKLLRLAGDDGPKFMNMFDTKHHQNCVTAIIQTVKHSVVSRKPRTKEEEELL